jgi:signal transduction histidine kinase
MNVKQRLKQMTHSMQWRLVALFILLALAMTAAFIGGTQRSFASGWREAIRPVLGDYIDRLAVEIGSPPNIDKAKILVARLPISIRIQGPTLNFDSHPDKHSERYEHRRADRYVAETNTQTLLTRSTTDGHTIRFGMGDLEWRKHPTGAALITLAALLILTALAYFAVRKLLRPLADISAGAKRFGNGDFKQAIPVRRKDELGELAAQINTMAIDIDSMLEAKRGLLLAISHELRSPLTRARVNVELLPDIGDNQQSRDALLRDLTAINQLVSDLLESERLNDKHAALNLQSTDVALLASEIANQFADQTIRLTLHLQQTHMVIDASRIRLLLRNLIENAIQHASDAQSKPELLVTTTPKGLAITMRDFGNGVEPSSLSKLAEPFYRTDSARQRITGGVGLGLYLCRLVVNAHGGNISFENASPGLRVLAVIPFESK